MLAGGGLGTAFERMLTPTVSVACSSSSADLSPSLCMSKVSQVTLGVTTLLAAYVGISTPVLRIRPSTGGRMVWPPALDT